MRKISQILDNVLDVCRELGFFLLDLLSYDHCLLWLRNWLVSVWYACNTLTLPRVESDVFVVCITLVHVSGLRRRRQFFLTYSVPVMYISSTILLESGLYRPITM